MRTDEGPVPGDCLRHFRRDLWHPDLVLQSCSPWAEGFQRMDVTLQQILSACAGIRVESVVPSNRLCHVGAMLSVAVCHSIGIFFCAGGLLNWL